MKMKKTVAFLLLCALLTLCAGCGDQDATEPTDPVTSIPGEKSKAPICS